MTWLMPCHIRKLLVTEGRGRGSCDANTTFHEHESGKCPCDGMDLASTENISELHIVQDTSISEIFLLRLCVSEMRAKGAWWLV